MFKQRGYAVFIIATLLIIVVGVYQYTRPVKFNGSVIAPPKPMPEFTLQSAKGPVSLGDFQGKLVVLFFGYTSCPDICPLTLANLRMAMEKLGDQATEVQVIFVSVDPQRDTPDKLEGYAHAFRTDFLGLTGTQSEIDAVARDFGIYYKLNEPDARGYYAVEHTATTLVLDRQGRFTLGWPNGTSPDAISEDLRNLIKQP